MLFVDIVGSTSLADRAALTGPEGAEQLGGLLNRYFANVIKVIADNGGDLIRIDGDAAIALWRGKNDAELPYLAAARAAIGLRDGVRGWAIDPTERLQHRVTVAAGRLAATILSCAEMRRHFLLSGAPLRTIGELASACEPGEIVVDEAFARAVRDEAELQSIADGMMRLVGLRQGNDQPLQPLGPRNEEAAARSLLPFVPEVVIERSKAGQAGWLAEFRILSVIYIRLLEPRSAAVVDSDRLQFMLDAISGAMRPLKLEIFDIVADDKGIVAKIVCGLPPFSHEGNASRALEGALRIRSMLAAAGISCPIGVATGRVFCSDVGTALRREYVLTGPAMNYGARLMQAAGTEVLCDEETLQATSGYFGRSNAEAIFIKGRTAPLTVYRFSNRPGGEQRPPALCSRLHGRDDELGRLIDCLDQARTGLVAIEGEAGAGKSRLLAEMSNAASGRGYTVIATAAHPIEQATPYFAFRSVLRKLLLWPEDPQSAAEDVFCHRLQEAFAGHPLAPRAALLEDIVPIGLPDKGLAPQITGSARRAGIEDLVVHLAIVASRAKPIALLIDDLHWIDESSTQLLITLARRVPRLLIVVASRPPEVGLAAEAARILDLASLRLPLTRLGRESIVSMVCELLGVRGIPPRLAEFVQQHSEGLPFHAEQLVLSLREQKLIEIDNGRCRVADAALTADVVAHNLRDLLVSRIDSLDPTDQLVAKVASAIGRVFDADMLREVFPLRDELPRLEASLRQLVAARILVPDRGRSGQVYSFQHIFIQEMTYELLSFSQRRPLHRRIAELLEHRHADDLQPYVAELADHWERAAEPEKAIEYRMRAAEIALQRHANENALMHIGRIDHLASRAGLDLPRWRVSEMARIRGESLHALSRFAEARQQFGRCAALSGIPVPATQLGLALATGREIVRQAAHRCGVVLAPADHAARDRDRLSARIHTRFAEHAYFMSNALPLVHGTLTALNRAERVGAVAETIEAYGGLAIGLGTAGQFRLADYYRDRSIALAEGKGGLQDRGFARLLASVYSFQAGQWPAAIAHSLAGAAICERVGDAFRYQSCCVIRAFTGIMTGDYAEAEALLGAFGDDAELIENIPVRAWVLSGLAILDMIRGRAPSRTLARIASAKDGSLHRAERLLCDGIEAAAQLRAGDATRARQLADAGVENLSNSVSTMGIALFSVCATAEVHLALGMRDDRSAGPDFRSARTACRLMRRYATQTRICRPRALRVEGELCFARGRKLRARMLLRSALREAEHFGMPLEQALCHLALSEAAASQGQRQAHHRSGAELLERLGANPWHYEGPRHSM